MPTQSAFIVFIVLAIELTLSGCSTMGEVASFNDSPSGYKRKAKGSNHYVRQRVVKRSAPIPSQSYYQQEPGNSLGADLLLAALTPPTRASSTGEPSPVRNSNPKTFVGVSLSVAKAEPIVHFGAELEHDFFSSWLAGRFGFSLLNSDFMYGGATLGARVSNPHWKISPHLGFEGYLGDHKSCEYQPLGSDEYLETCDKVFLGSTYLEGGARWNISKQIRLYAFTRGYSKVDQTLRRDWVMFFGTSLMFGF